MCFQLFTLVTNDLVGWVDDPGNPIRVVLFWMSYYMFVFWNIPRFWFNGAWWTPPIFLSENMKLIILNRQYHVWLRICYGAVTRITSWSWTQNPNLVNMWPVLTWITMLRSAGLLWYVQNCDLIDSLLSKLQQIVFCLQDSNYKAHESFVKKVPGTNIIHSKNYVHTLRFAVFCYHLALVKFAHAQYVQCYFAMPLHSWMNALATANQPWRRWENVSREF